MLMRARDLVPRVYFFLLLCANSTVFGMVFGGHAAMNAGSTSSAFSSGSSDPVLLAINLSLGIVTAILVFPKLPAIFALLGKVKIIALLYILAALSVLWSTSRVDTFRSFIYLAMYLAGAAYLSVRLEIHEIIDSFTSSITLLALACIPANYYFPRELFNEDSWHGVFLTKNGLGSVMAIGLISILLQNRRWNLRRLLSFALCATVLALSKSVSSYAIVIFTISILIYMRINRRLAMGYLTVVFGGAIGATMLAGNIAEKLTSAAGKDLTFSGRTAIWVLVLQKIRERPLLGYGYRAFWSTEADSVNQFLNGFQPGQAHNGYLEACLDLGLIGLFLCLIALFQCFRKGLWLNRKGPYRSGDLALFAIITILVHDFAESDMMLVSAVWFFVITAFLVAARTQIDLCDAALQEDLSEDALSDSLSGGEGHCVAGASA